MKCFDRGKKRWRRNVRFRFGLTEPRYTASTINWEQRLQTTYLEQLLLEFGNEENGHWSREVERRILTGPLQMLRHVCRNDTVVWLIKGNTFLMSIQAEIPSFPFIFSPFLFFLFLFCLFAPLFLPARTRFSSVNYAHPPTKMKALLGKVFSFRSAHPYLPPAKAPTNWIYHQTHATLSELLFYFHYDHDTIWSEPMDAF